MRQRHPPPPKRAVVLLMIALAAHRAAGQTSPAPLYQNARLATNDRVRDLIGRMTLEEKFWQLFMIPGDLDDPANDYSRGIFGLQIAAAPGVTGSDAARAHAERINAIQQFFVERTRLGIPIIPFDEALHGLVRDGATVFPQAIALAATWDSALVSRVATAVAHETRSRGVRQVLSPVVNIANDVRWGRVEETYGEDPHLTSVMGRSFVRAFETAGIVTTPKHFVANVGDGGRDSYPIDLSARLLDEIHFPPFRSAVQTGARSVMTAYNSVDGLPATQNRPLLTEKLKREWGFTGFVISDAAATGGATVLHHTEANTPLAAKHAFEAGLDVVFQSSFDQHRPYLRAFQQGLVADSVIDNALARVLRAKFELGLFERPFVDADSAAYWNGHETHRRLAREAARAAIVLLKNERSTLPLPREFQSLAVIGRDAQEARLGGYSGAGIRSISILAGLRAGLDSATQIRYAPGPPREGHQYVVIDSRYLSTATEGVTRPGVRGEYFDNNRLAGTPRIVRTDPRIDFRWTLNSPAQGIPFDWYSARWSGTLTVPPEGVQRIGIEGNDGYRLWLGGKLIIDNWIKRSYGARFADVSLAAGERQAFVLEYFESTGNARLKLVWDSGVRQEWRAEIDSAVALTRVSDAAIIVAGIEEGEFRDRAFLGLPGHQAELITAIAATEKPVIVVLIGGSAITMPWLEHADAIVHAWYPGEEGGHAVADVLFGEYNPAGRLPITFPMSEGQLPLIYNHKPTGRGDDYLDLTGQPLFPFGFGLSLTAFEYSGLRIQPNEVSADANITVQCTVKNVGSRAGDEVVQLYVRDVLASVSRPVMELKGFTRVHLAPGEEQRVTFTLTPEHLRMLDADMRWVVEPGVFRVLVGASSKDIRLRAEVLVR
ncbi:MAG: glycoside hydrolase family 3 N-terminal domain-containing protein [Gemmatimonadaceae bacterium]